MAIVQCAPGMEEDDGVSAEDITPPVPVPRRRPPDPQRLKIENNATLDPAHREFLLGRVYDLTAPLAASMQQRADALRPPSKRRESRRPRMRNSTTRLAKEAPPRPLVVSLLPVSDGAQLLAPVRAGRGVVLRPAALRLRVPGLL